MKHLNLFETFEYEDLTPKDVEPHHMHVHQTTFDIGSKELGAPVDDIILLYNSDDDAQVKDEIVTKLRRIALLTGESGPYQTLEVFNPDEHDTELGTFKYRVVKLNGFNVIRIAWHDNDYDGINIWGYLIEKKYLKFVKSFSVTMFKDYSMQELIELYDELDGDVSQVNKLTEGYTDRNLSGNLTMDTVVYRKAVECGMDEEVGVFFEYDTHYDTFHTFYFDNKDKFTEFKTVDEEIFKTSKFSYQCKMTIYKYNSIEYAKGNIITYNGKVQFSDFTFLVTDHHQVAMAIDYEIPLEYVESFMTLSMNKDREMFKKICKSGATEIIDDYAKGELSLEEMKTLAQML